MAEDHIEAAGQEVHPGVPAVPLHDPHPLPDPGRLGGQRLAGRGEQGGVVLQAGHRVPGPGQSQGLRAQAHADVEHPQLLPRRVGPGRAAELIFTGRRVPADEALTVGLVDRLVAAGTARSAALELAVLIATKSPVSLRAAKRALRAAANGLDEGLVSEGRAWEDAAFSADRVEGIDAFNAGRQPHWPGWDART